MSYNKQHLRLEDGALEVRDQDVFHQPLLLDEETVLSEETCLVSDSLKRIGKNQMYSMTKIIYIYTYIVKQGFPGGASGKESTCRCRLDPWVGKIPWRRAWQPTPVFLPGESQGQRSLAGYSP